MKFLFDLFFNKINTKFLWSQAFNYKDRTTGVRIPDSPTGILNSEQGHSQIYSGVNKVKADLNEGVIIEGNRIILNSVEIDIASTNVENIKINGQALNSKIFDSDEYVLVSKKALEGLLLVTNETVVVNNKLVNTVPLTEVLERVNLIKPTQPLPPSPEVRIAKSLNLNVPKWLE